MLNDLLFALFFSTLIATLAYWRGSLSRSGSIGTVLVGTLTFGFGGWVWGVLLVLFFMSSSLLSHYKEGEKQAAAEKFDKGHRRDMGQVFANGGLGALTAVCNTLFPSPLWFPFFVGIMATVTADTWATELGTLSRRTPRLITTGRTVEVGTSGGVSWLGTAVSFIGGIFIGLFAGLLSQKMIVALTLIGGIGGLGGSLFDSLLGATVQQVYYCDLRHKETEKKLNSLGQPNQPLRGWKWMNNDVVNLGASFVGGSITVLLFYLLT